VVLGRTLEVRHHQVVEILLCAHDGVALVTFVQERH